MRRETIGALEVEQKRIREMEEDWEDKLNAMEERHEQELARLAEDYNAHKRVSLNDYLQSATLFSFLNGLTNTQKKLMKRRPLQRDRSIVSIIKYIYLQEDGVSKFFFVNACMSAVSEWPQTNMIF
jgi:hypothetical protein